MSLVYIDGFDHYATADLPQKGWTVAGTYTDKQSIAATGGRRGSGGLRFTNLNGVLSAYVIRAVPSQQTIIVGFNVNLSAIPQGGSSPWTFFNLLDGATSQIALVINNSGSVTVRRGNGTNLGTTSEVLVAGDNYLELRTTIDPTAGAYEVRLNGVTVLAATGVNTRQSENSAVNALSFGVYEAGSTITNSFLMTIDDLYIASTAGSTNNYFLGDVRIDTLFPTADGTYSQFTPSKNLCGWLIHFSH